jgi:hypothetical protein
MPILDKDLLKEYPKLPSEDYLDMCKSYNLLVIIKSEGKTNIRYDESYNKNRSECLQVFRNNIRYFRIALKKAIYHEQYEIAARLRDKILSNQSNIDTFKNNFYDWSKKIYEVCKQQV